MQKALERDLFLHADESDRAKILGMFRLANTIQLPVICDEHVVGILDLFDFLNDKSKQIQICDIMETNISVAGDTQSVFTFRDSKQLILPFVDEDGRYMGFVNKILQKCYVPSQEYMRVVGDCVQHVVDGQGDISMEQVKNTFSFILESNFDGLYITVDKGKTLSYNTECTYTNGISSINMSVDSECVIMKPLEENQTDIQVVQLIQHRNEMSVSNDVLSDGGLVRIVDNINSIKRELQEARELKDKYENELEFLRLEQSKTEGIIANSEEMKKIIHLALRIAKVDSTVLIQGQSGVGKGVISKLIHNNSPRKNGPFIKIDCGSIPEQLLESELFGYEQGAFTGALKGGKVGLVEVANNGTLFLDEIGELPLALQAKLLRMIQDKEIIRVGSNQMIPINIRIIAATNRNLEEMVKEGSFRNDLYYRLHVVPIHIPPLCDRTEDIKPLIQSYLAVYNRKYGYHVQMDASAYKALIDYSWPGNVRQLENMIEYLVVTCNADLITIDHIPDSMKQVNRQEIFSLGEIMSLKEAVEQLEKRLLEAAMRKTRSTEEMATMLKQDRSTILRKMRKYNMKSNFHASE